MRPHLRAIALAPLRFLAFVTFFAAAGMMWLCERFDVDPEEL